VAVARTRSPALATRLSYPSCRYALIAAMNHDAAEDNRKHDQDRLTPWRQDGYLW